MLGDFIIKLNKKYLKYVRNNSFYVKILIDKIIILINVEKIYNYSVVEMVSCLLENRRLFCLEN